MSNNQTLKDLKLKDIYSKTLKIVKFNLILVQPLLIFLLIFGFSTRSFEGVKTFETPMIFILLALFGLLCAFLAGWYSMFDKCIKNSVCKNFDEKQMAEDSIKLFSEFTSGIGKYFFKVIFGVIVYVILCVGVLFLCEFIGQKYIGMPQGLTQQNLAQALVSQEKAVDLVSKLSGSDLKILSKWNLMTTAITAVFSYLTMFWFVALIAGNKNPISAFWDSVVKVLKKPLETFAIFMSFWVSSFIVLVISSLGVNNFIIEFITLMIYVFLVIYFVTMLFLYYGKQTEINCDSGADSLG